MTTPTLALVVPTVGRASLPTLLDALGRCTGPRPRRIVVADDRRDAPGPLTVEGPGWTAGVVRVVTSGGRGPAAARNVGWRSLPDVEWVVFVDDDVLVGSEWFAELAEDLTCAGPDVGGVQGVLEVPLPTVRRPTDWERGTAGLATSKWITADMAYRRAVLEQVDGFDERFPRAFREDADLALRVQNAGYRLVVGTRRSVHPVRPARWSASLGQQRGNADDVLMTRVHGRDWRARAGAPRGRRARHLATTAAGLGALTLLTGRRPGLAAVAAAGWAGATAEFAAARIAPGPRDATEVTRMIVTSAAIPPAAAWHWIGGLVRHRRVRPAPSARGGGGSDAGTAALVRPAAVLVDRDGTIVHDVPYNADPAQVRPVPGARESLDRLRAQGVRVGVVSNQSGVARGLIEVDQLAAVNARVEELLGPFDVWAVCVHDDADECVCRKPRPGLVLAAADALSVEVSDCLVIGDTGADVIAAQRAGAQGILVPTAATRAEEIGAAPVVRSTFSAAVDDVLQRPARR